MTDFFAELSHILSHFDESIDKDTGDAQIKFNLKDILKAMGINNFDEFIDINTGDIKFKSNPNKTSTENAQAKLNLQDILKAMGNVGVNVATSNANFPETHFTNSVTPSTNIIKTDIKETETNFIVYFDVPGVQKDSIKLSIGNDNTLLISVEKFNPSSSDIFHLKERNEGVFTRSLKLPPKIDVNSINAKLNLGVLVVKFSKESITPELRNINID